MPDYAAGKIYCIRNTLDNKIVYVGSTTRPLSERMAEHRKATRLRPNIMKITTMMKDRGAENFAIELLADFPCQRREQLAAEEGRIIRLHGIGSLTNSYIAGRTKIEYETEHSVEKKAYMKRWNEANQVRKYAYQQKYQAEHAEALKAQKKQYYITNRNTILEKRRAYLERKKNPPQVVEIQEAA